MTITPRMLVTDFSTANPIYAGSSISFFTVDINGAATTTLATLYSGLNGTSTLANPQILDSEGKFTAPVYINTPVIASVTDAGVDDHSTGVIVPTGIWRGVWATATSYQIGQIVSVGSSIYISTTTHTSTSLNSPLVDPVTWETIVDFGGAILDAVTAINITTGVGDGTAGALTLTSAPAYSQNVLFYIGGVRQDTTAYTVDGLGHLTPGGAIPLGVAWEALAFSSISAVTPVPASLVAVSPTVAGASNTQSALSAINTTAGTAATNATTALANAATALSTANTANTAATTASSAAATAQATATSALAAATDPIIFTDLAASIIASQAEAEAGSATNVLMNPLRVAQAIAALASSTAAGRLLGYQIFTASGTYTKATNNPSFIIAELIGGGGGGGGCDSNTGAAAAGGGGGAGGFCRKKILASALSASETVTVGAGGAGGLGPTGPNGSAGGTSSLGAHCSASGGAGGHGTGTSTTTVTMTPGGVGGLGASGDINSRGEAGGTGIGVYSGVTGSSSQGAGGSSNIAGGRGAYSASGNADTGLAAAANSGCGGSGGSAANTTATAAGGAGGSGVVIIMEFS